MTEAILAVPVLAKVLVALSLILVVNHFCRRLVVSVGAGALALAVWSGHSPRAMLEIAWRRFASPSNLLLLVIVFQVIWLSSQMSLAGVMQDLVGAVRARVSRRAAMAVLPAAIGLLPMPGGALFSAPLVDSCDAEGSIPATLKAQTNHWFRHVWEYWWPLYPGVLLAMEITKLEVWQFMLIGLPLSLCAIAAGRLFLLRHVKPQDAGPAPVEPTEAGPRLPALMLPIAVVIAGYAAVRSLYACARVLWPNVPDMNRYIPMVVGLCAAVFVLQRQRPLRKAQWRSILLAPRAFNMVAIVAMVSVYGAFVEARLPSGEPLVAQMRAEMAQWGVPFLVIMMLLPLVSGLATGLSVGFVGASFPIVISLLGDQPSLRTLFSTTVLAYGFGYMGMLLSPVHVCLIVTSEHFQTAVLRNVAGLLRPAVMMLAATLIMYLALR